MTIRKNFLFNKEIVRHLEEIAKEEGKTQTQAVQEAIESKYKYIKKKRKLEIFNLIINSCNGEIGDIDIKNIKEERALNRAK